MYTAISASSFDQRLAAHVHARRGRLLGKQILLRFRDALYAEAGGFFTCIGRRAADVAYS